MERYVFPGVSDRPVSEVNTVDVLEILMPIWHMKPETARAVRQRIRSVIELGSSPSSCASWYGPVSKRNSGG